MLEDGEHVGTQITRRARLLARHCWPLAAPGARLRLELGRGGGGGGGSGGRRHAAGSTLTVADVAPFTGTDAALGPTYLVSCDAATNAINNAGGVLGHKFDLQVGRHPRRPGRRRARGPPDVRVDVRTSALVIGCTSDEAASVVPVFAANKTVSFCMTGQSEFDHVKFPYFYRLVPPDLSESYAMVAIAKNRGYKRDRAGVRQRHRLPDVRRPGDRGDQEGGHDAGRPTRPST